MFRETEVWDSIPTVVPLVEKIMSRAVSTIQAENGKNTILKLLSYIVPSRVVGKKVLFIVI